MRTTVCLIRCGSIAEAHAVAYERLADRVRVVVYDVDRDAAEALCARHRFVGVLRRLDEVLGAVGVDAVDICVPHDVHEGVAVACASAGKHLLIEKPIARTLAEADRILCAAERSGVTLMVAENYRFYPPVVEARRLVAQGAIGRLTVVQTNSWQFHTPVGWRRERVRCGGGCLLDRGIHFLDLALNLAGPVASVFAVRPPQVIREMEGEDGGLVLMQHRSGAVSETNVTWGTPGAPPAPWFVACGTEGALFDYGGLWLHRKGEERCLVPAESDQVTMEREVRHFLDCLETGAKPLVTGRDGRDALQLVLAAYESMETGRVVQVASVEENTT